MTKSKTRKTQTRRSIKNLESVGSNAFFRASLLTTLLKKPIR
ncbi:hypothetical protein KU06112801_120082 [Flavobacterium psychrophilum]|nr:hypothetical protein KU06112801_120082 [Flavobacterium psychrophilum]